MSLFQLLLAGQITEFYVIDFCRMDSLVLDRVSGQEAQDFYHRKEGSNRPQGIIPLILLAKSFLAVLTIAKKHK